jgi:hypothetical protein
LRQGYSTTGNDKPTNLDSINISSGQDIIMSSAPNGGQVTIATQPPPLISAVDNSFKNMQILQNTNSGEGSQKQGESSNGNNNSQTNNS